MNVIRLAAKYSLVTPRHFSSLAPLFSVSLPLELTTASAVFYYILTAQMLCMSRRQYNNNDVYGNQLVTHSHQQRDSRAVLNIAKGKKGKIRPGKNDEDPERE